MKVLLVNPPLSGPSGPYPAICYLAGFLDSVGIEADMADASLSLLLRILSPDGLRDVREAILERFEGHPEAPDGVVRSFLTHYPWFHRTIETAVACLQGHDRGAVARASVAGYFPPALSGSPLWASAGPISIQNYADLLGELSVAQGQRLFASKESLRFAFGTQGATDLVRYCASMMVKDVALVIERALDRHFRLDGYATMLRRDAATFDALRARLEAPPGLIDRLIDDEASALVSKFAPGVFGLTVPFVGSLYGALRMARVFKKMAPGIPIVIGGGWVNTTLRHLSDPGIFDYVDFISLDDGERPLLSLLEHLQGDRPVERLRRTFIRRDDGVRLMDGGVEGDIPFGKGGTPTYRGLPLTKYLAYFPVVGELRVREPGARWNKLTLAHGCYWKKCTFCDTSLDYIGRYEPASVETLIGQIRRLKAETGESGFHFVDEAMPPALMRRLAERLIEEELAITWWGNVRFDAALAPLAPLLVRSGCVRITGGLEVASDRLLSLMRKGVSLRQAAQVTHALSTAGLSVHTYLMFGFPTQTVQETIDALEFVRQLFKAGCVHTAFWHSFVLTADSPIAADPAAFSVQLPPRPRHPFSNYILDFEEAGRADPRQFGRGLRDATNAFTAGLGLDRPVHLWFPTPMPVASIAPDLVERYLEQMPGADIPEDGQ